MQNWIKLGRIFVPNGLCSGMITHAAAPLVADIKGDVANIFFSSRDAAQVSSIFSLDFDIRLRKVTRIDSSPVLTSGALGCFDDSGVMGSCVLKDGAHYKLYYIGWNLGVTVPFRNSIGLAVSANNRKYERSFHGPVIDRTKDEPHFTASSCVIKEGDIYRIWYLSCTGWMSNNFGPPTHRYHIKYAESVDGINWIRNGDVAIDYADEYEFAIAVPRVLKDGGLYKMWFSSRASATEDTYRIRYAESPDGITWVRKDKEIGLTVSDSDGDWDSDMVCYPFVFDHKGYRYMLYNGNGYGKSGFGLAVLDAQ